MFVELLVNALEFDTEYFVSLVFGNLFWVFAFFCAAYFFSKGRRVILNFFVIVFLVFSFLDLVRAHELIFYTASSLILVYLSRLTVLTFIESVWKSPRYLRVGYSLVTYGALIFYNFFML